MKTVFILMAQYDKAIIPVEQVCADYFAPLTLTEFMRKTKYGEIDLPIVRIYDSQKATKGVPVEDLAAYLDQRIALARKDVETMKK